jgi:D-glycero-D-manno-heptose 1,7-bisphosphate phosphatase
LTRRALFLDRDGVINVDRGYVHKAVDVDFVDGIFDLVSLAVKFNYLIIVVTNQAGIGRGFYSEQDFHRLMDWMGGEFIARKGRLDAVYFSPFHPQYGLGEYRRRSECRKPAPGMLLRAQRDLDINLAHSVLIGDKQSDIAAGIAAGVGTVLGLRVDESAGCDGWHRIGGLHEATDYLISRP